MNTTNTKILKDKYNEIISNYKKEIEKLKRDQKSIKVSQYEKKCKQNENYLISTLSVLLDMIEIFISQRWLLQRDSVLKTISNHDISSSSFEKFEIYDSYNMEDDKRNTLIDQIIQILISKLKYLQIVLNIDLEKEIGRVHSWSPNRETNISLNISNLKILKKENTKESYTSCKPFLIQAEHSSNLFQSPKFCNNISFESLKDINESHKFRVFEMKDVLNDSLADYNVGRGIK